MKKQLLFTFFVSFLSLQAFSQDVVKSLVSAFSVKFGAMPTFDNATSNLNSIRFPIERPFIVKGETPSAKALSFMNDNIDLFQMKKGDDYHEVKESNKDNYGKDHVSLQQYYKGVTVFDGLLKFHFNKDVNLTSMNGNFIAIDKLNPVPSISMAEAEELALKHASRLQLNNETAPLKVNKNNLYVFQKGLAQGFKGPIHLVYEVEVRNDREIREFIYIDAHTKELVEQFTGIHDAGLDRRLYETSYSPGSPATNLKWTEGESLPDPDLGGVRPTLDVWQLSEVETAGQMYYMMKNAFGHGSYNGGTTLATELPMITVNNDPGIQCPNANWNGTTANYCTGVAADDIVAHEWAHAYTEYTSGLIYAYQAGALNESYSDVWGEIVDQINGYFDSEETTTPRTACGSSNKWMMGEKSTAFGGAIRDMWNPNCKGDAGKVSDSQYVCDPGFTDNGGVHSNSGIPNHAFALLVDGTSGYPGGVYNSQTIAGIGLLKAAHIWWYAQKNLMTRTTDFSAQADNLEAALTALIGVNLYSLSTSATAPTLSGISISDADLSELRKVLLAVEMRSENNCGFTTLLQPLPTICAGGSAANAIYFEDFEDGILDWTTTNTAGVASNWTPRNWVASNTPPPGKTGTVAFGLNSNTGDCASNIQNGVINFASPVITIPAKTSGPYYLAFDHYVAMERKWDGGNLQFSINGGAFELVPTTAFIANGYNTTLTSSGNGNNNPLAGQSSFTGADGGKLTGTWGQSRINLMALPGSLLVDNSPSPQTIKFRWRVGQDGCGGWDGWYIDDVRVYSCAWPTVQFVNTTTILNEGEANILNDEPNNCLPYVEKIVTIKINKAPTLPVTVTINSDQPLGTAKMGTTKDYSISPSSVVLKQDQLSQDIIVRVYNDDNLESNEDFTLTYTLSGDGDGMTDTSNQSHTFTIIDDDIEPGLLQTQVLYENFQNGIPLGWHTYTGEGILENPEFIYPSSWGLNTLINNVDPNGTTKLIANSDAYGNLKFDKIVESAPFNTLGASAIHLSFLEYFNSYSATSDFNEVGTVEVSDGAGNWHNILTHNEADGDIGSAATPFSRQISIPIAYSNVAMKIRFRYIAKYDFYWIIDNVKVITSFSTQVQSEVNTSNPSEAYLGPMETVVFYDPTSGNLLAKIKNLSNFDYGCTTVEINRAGSGQTFWNGTNNMSSKTIKVTPTTNNPAGEYEITLYYTNDEKTGLIINSMVKTSVTDIGSTVIYSSGQGDIVLNNDYSYKATFNTGFSSFGLSDAFPVSIPLPVKLISFEGNSSPQGNHLKWLTAEEKNAEAFVLERSDNAKDFKAITQLKAKGNSKENNSYSYLDNTYSGLINYYRLKQIDVDGKYSYSKVVAIESKNEFNFSILPNPIVTNLNIKVPFSDDEIVEIKIVSNIGAEMANKQVKAKNGIIIQEMSGFVPGIYHVILKAKNKTTNYKIIKQ